MRILCKLIGHRPGPDLPFQHVVCERCEKVLVRSVVGDALRSVWHKDLP